MKEKGYNTKMMAVGLGNIPLVIKKPALHRLEIILPNGVLNET